MIRCVVDKIAGSWVTGAVLIAGQVTLRRVTFREDGRSGLQREPGWRGRMVVSGPVVSLLGCVGGRWGERGQALEGGLDGGQVVEGVEAAPARLRSSPGVWGPPKHEEAEDGGLVAAKIEDGADAVLVLGDAGVADGGDEGEVFKGMESLANLFFGEIKDGIAAGALIARVKQSVEGERIVLWRGDLFFDERAEDAELMGREMHRYKGATGEGPVGRDDNEEHVCRLTRFYFSMKIRCGRCCRMRS